MRDEDVVETNTTTSSVPAAKSSPYELLVRQSKKLGAVATKAFHDMAVLLHRDIPFPSAERLLASFPRVHILKSKKDADEVTRLKRAVKKSHQVLASAHTVFPMTLFRDSIIVDRTKVSIIKRDFFWTSNVISFQIEDILNVSCSIGPLFGSLTIVSRVMSSEDHFHINYLWRNDAVIIKRIIQGHCIAKNSKIGTDHLSRQEMMEMLCELGTDSER
jgi:hypothetical protein